MHQLFESFLTSSSLYNECSFKLRNFHRLSYIFLDSFFGILLIYLFPNDVEFGRIFWNYFHFSIEQLESLIKWLTQNPAGLKLNDALNSFLSSFFLYHIHLWRTYVTALEHSSINWLLIVSGTIGLSILLAFVADFLRILTVHMFCFHIYTHR